MTNYSNRIKKTYKTIKLPSVYTPEDRGIESCCCKFLVFGSSENDPWKQNKTSAWIRDVDSWRFYVTRKSDGLEVDIDDQTPFLEASARYCTVDWSTILDDYGGGCYSLSIDYDISGITGTMLWAEYELMEFSLHAAREYVQFRTVLNSLQTIDNINFRNSNVVDCINFKGTFGFANPNTQVENNIYSDRISRKVVRENLYEYELISKPLSECLTSKILDLHLLSENEIYVSDFNPMNHHQYLNTPCIVESVEKPDYLGQFAKIKAKFGDKTKNKRSRYGY